MDKTLETINSTFENLKKTVSNSMTSEVLENAFDQDEFKLLHKEASKYSEDKKDKRNFVREMTITRKEWFSPKAFYHEYAALKQMRSQKMQELQKMPQQFHDVMQFIEKLNIKIKEMDDSKFVPKALEMVKKEAEEKRKAATEEKPKEETPKVKE